MATRVFLSVFLIFIASGSVARESLTAAERADLRAGLSDLAKMPNCPGREPRK